MINTVIIEPAERDYGQYAIRPKKNAEDLKSTIDNIFTSVENGGDSALRDLTAKYDDCEISNLMVTKQEIATAGDKIDEKLKSSIQVAKANILKFHNAQKSSDVIVDIVDGVQCMQLSVPIKRVGIYIPGGTAPLFSTVLMLAIPATLAGCDEVILCTPPDASGNINPAILWAADLCGVDKIFKVGGAQAIAAMSLGTQSIPKVSKVFGPGNQYVTAAKLFAQRYGVAMDMPAGPSELLVYATQSSIPSFVAADLLSQAEHGEDSQVILVATNKGVVDQVNEELKIQVAQISRKEIARKALDNSRSIILKDVMSAFDFINSYAPEHLIIADDNPSQFVKFIVNAGSVFLGNYCPESAGDYASGTNHTLPTDGWAQSYNGVNLDSYCRKITYQNITKNGISNLGHTVINMANAEGLDAHANAVKIRLDYLNRKST